jgi:hypothetical protein
MLSTGVVLLLACWHVVLHLASSASVFPYEFDLVAEFVTIDYLWDSNHSRSLYEESGEFVVANNVLTGIKVSSSGDIFVAIPRWMSGVPSSLNKLAPNPNGEGYVLDPWPSWEFNAINTSLFPSSLQYAQSFIIDSQQRMWIPDVGRTNFFDANPSLVTSAAASLMIVDVATGELLFKYFFPEDVVSYNNSFVNDIVLDEVNGYAYLTDTWGEGGVIVFDANTNSSHQFSSAATNRNTSYDFCVNGVCYGTDGVGASPSDGIALSDDLSTLYFSPVQGQGVYSVPTALLQDFGASDADFQAAAVLMGLKIGCSDGLLSLNGQLIYGDIQSSGLALVPDINAYASAAGSLTLSDSIESAYSAATLNWIDTFSSDFQDPNAFYFTSNRLNLFFATTMDFTGQSGSNFRIYHATLSGSSEDSDNPTLRRTILGVGFGVILLMSAGAYYYRWRMQKQAGTEFSTSDTVSSLHCV